MRKQNPNFTPAYPVATSPVMCVPPQPEDKVFVDHPNAARVLDFANSIYGLIVGPLVQSFGRRGEAGRATMKRHLACAIGLMHVLDAAGRGLAAMPARRTADGVHASVSFTMLRAVDPLFSGQAEERLITERLQELAQGVRIAVWANPALSTLSVQLAQVEAGWSAEAVASATERTGQSVIMGMGTPMSHSRIDRIMNSSMIRVAGTMERESRMTLNFYVPPAYSSKGNELAAGKPAEDVRTCARA